MQQRSFGVPGAALSGAGFDPALTRMAASAERHVARLLDRVAATRSDCVVFHSVRAPHSIGDMDHVVIAGTRVVLVDTKRWAQAEEYICDGAGERDAALIRMRHQDGDETRSVPMPYYIKLWSRVLEVPDVSGVIALVTPQPPRISNRQPFAVVGAAALEEFLLNQLGAEDPAGADSRLIQMLTPLLVEECVQQTPKSVHPARAGKRRYIKHLDGRITRGRVTRNINGRPIRSYDKGHAIASTRASLIKIGKESTQLTAESRRILWWALDWEAPIVRVEVRPSSGGTAWAWCDADGVGECGEVPDEDSERVLRWAAIQLIRARGETRMNVVVSRSLSAEMWRADQLWEQHGDRPLPDGRENLDLTMQLIGELMTESVATCQWVDERNVLHHAEAATAHERCLQLLKDAARGADDIPAEG